MLFNDGGAVAVDEMSHKKKRKLKKKSLAKGVEGKPKATTSSQIKPAKHDLRDDEWLFTEDVLKKAAKKRGFDADFDDDQAPDVAFMPAAPKASKKKGQITGGDNKKFKSERQAAVADSMSSATDAHDEAQIAKAKSKPIARKREQQAQDAAAVASSSPKKLKNNNDQRKVKQMAASKPRVKKDEDEDSDDDVADELESLADDEVELVSAANSFAKRMHVNYSAI